MFYGTNHFHIELGNFERNGAEYFRAGCPREVKRCPADWWRAIGDINVRIIRHFSIVGQPNLHGSKCRGVMVTYKRQVCTEMKQHPGGDVIDQTVQETIDRQTREKKLQAQLKLVGKGALSIEAIEEIATCLLPREIRFFLDRTRLGAGAGEVQGSRSK